jgi:N-acetyl-beta-hexosaminidase
MLGVADTSFNFITPAAIKGVLDAMSYAKLNVLHWHATGELTAN